MLICHEALRRSHPVNDFNAILVELPQFVSLNVSSALFIGLIVYCTAILHYFCKCWRRAGHFRLLVNVNTASLCLTRCDQHTCTETFC